MKPTNDGRERVIQKFYIEEDCPECGGEMWIQDNADGGVYDGDNAICDCGYSCGVSVSEDGNSMWLQD